MAIVREQAHGSGHYGSGGFGAQTATFPNAVKTGSLLVCAWWGNSNTGNATCADNINGSWTALTQRTPVSGSGRRFNIFYKLASASSSAGGMTVTVTPVANAGNTESMQIVEYSGISAYNASAETYSTFPSGSSISLSSAAGTAANDLLLYVLACDTESAHTFSATSGITGIVLGTSDSKTGGQSNGSATLAIGEKLVAASGANACTMGIGVGDDGGRWIVGFTASTSATITKTQTATARIAVTVTKTQPATARIANTRTKLQTAISRIANTRTKTQSATANITTAGTVTKTQSAVARIANTRTLTQSAIARIARTVTKTQTATGRIANTRTKTQSAVARVAKSVTKTQTATARIIKSVTKTQTATARISNIRTKTQSAIARLANTRTLTQSAIARIAKNGSKTQSAIARIANGRNKTQTATARVISTITVTKTQTAQARISNSRTKTQTATARIKQTIYRFTPPIEYGPERRGRSHFWRNFKPQLTGRSVLKINGEYKSVRYPKIRELRAAEVAYVGGHEHDVSAQEASELTAAGYTVEVIL